MLLKPKKKGLMLPSTAPLYATTGSSLPIATYIQLYNNLTYASSVITVTNANIGTASSDRLVVVILYDTGGNIITSSPTVTIQGISASVTASAVAFSPGPGNTYTGIAYANVPTGTTGTIVATYSSASGTSVAAIDIYTITGLSSFTPVGNSAQQPFGSPSVTATTTTLATTSGGVIIVGANQYVSASATCLITSGSGETIITDDPNFIPGSGLGMASSAHASNVGTNASNSVTATWTTPSASNTISVASWR